MPNIAYYVSSHGYGHGARQQAIIRVLMQDPTIQIYVRTGAPQKFFTSATAYHLQRYDIGMIQQDALTMNIEASLQWMADFLAQDEARLIQQEIKFCESTGINLIISDMPPLACELASQIGIDVLVLTHFTWDWVYAHYMEAFPQFAYIVDHLRAQYQKTTLALQMQLPFPHAFDMFPTVEPIGLVHNPATRSRQEIRALFEIPDGMPMILLSMGGHQWQADNIEALLAMKDVIFLVMPDVWAQVKDRATHFRLVPMTFTHYQDLIASADAVVGKAGGSTVAEVLGHQTPMIYTTQHPTDWREARLLAQTLDTHAVSLHVPADAFIAGDWVAQLPEFLKRPPTWTAINRQGVADATEKILRFIKWL